MKETEKIELKKSMTQLKEGIISCAAMLNKNHSGTVIFGINDDGRVCGITNPTNVRYTDCRFVEGLVRGGYPRRCTTACRDIGR